MWVRRSLETSENVLLGSYWDFRPSAKNSRGQRAHVPSLRSKRFRGVREQRKTEERDFRCFARAKNGARANNFLPSFPSPTPLFRFLALAPFFAREKHRKSRSSVFLCSQTPRKRLLPRLMFPACAFENARVSTVALGYETVAPQLLLHCFVEPVLHHFYVHRQHQEWDRSASTLANREGTQVCFLFCLTFSLKYLTCVQHFVNYVYVGNAFMVVALTE